MITRHKLGFTAVPLLRIGPYRFVLHWWAPGKADPDVHNHRWDWSSVVLWGSLAERRYVLEDGRGWEAFRCQPSCQPEPEPFRRCVLLNDAAGPSRLQRSPLP